MARHRWRKETGWINLDTGEKEEPPSKPFIRSKIQIAGDYEGYTCPITGKWIEGRAAHRENLKRHGCRILERGERRQLEERRREESDRESAKFVESVMRDVARRM